MNNSNGSIIKAETPDAMAAIAKHIASHSEYYQEWLSDGLAEETMEAVVRILEESGVSPDFSTTNLQERIYSLLSQMFLQELNWAAISEDYDNFSREDVVRAYLDDKEKRCGDSI